VAVAACGVVVVAPSLLPILPSSGKLVSLPGGGSVPGGGGGGGSVPGGGGGGGSVPGGGGGGGSVPGGGGSGGGGGGGGGGGDGGGSDPPSSPGLEPEVTFPEKLAKAGRINATLANTI
jgi:hypothetical protein